MASFNLTALAALAVDTGVEVIADNYNPKDAWYDGIAEVVSAADISHPPLGHKSTTIAFGKSATRRLDSEPIASTGAGQGYTPQGGVKLYAGEFRIPQRQIDAVGSNPKAMVRPIAEWQRNFLRDAANNKGSIVAKMLVNGGKTAGDKTLYDGSFLGNADPNIGKGYDGVCWFSGSHPLAQASGTTKSNTLGASGITLNTTNLDGARVRMAVTNAVSESNQPITVRPRVLVVPETLRSTAVSLLDSPQLPGSPNNDVNAWATSKSGITYRSSSFLDAESTTAWFMFGDLGGLVVIDSGPPEFRTWFDERTKEYVISAEYGFECFLRDFRDIVAANVATS